MTNKQVTYTVRETDNDGTFYVRSDTVEKLVTQFAEELVGQNIKEFDRRDGEFENLEELQEEIGNEFHFGAGIVDEVHPQELKINSGHSRVTVRLSDAVKFEFKEQLYSKQSSRSSVESESDYDGICEECGEESLILRDGKCSGCRIDVDIPSVGN